MERERSETAALTSSQRSEISCGCWLVDQNPLLTPTGSNQGRTLSGSGSKPASRRAVRTTEVAVLSSKTALQIIAWTLPTVVS